MTEKEMTIKERTSRMTKTILAADMWAQGYPTEETGIALLAKEMETLQNDAEIVLLAIEKALPALPEK